jgi:hypothetical protein
MPGLPMLAAWGSFYMIVGSAAAALTGLQFVVIAFIADKRAIRRESLDAFGTPTIVHFCAVLLVTAILCAPWHSGGSLGLALVLAGAAGVAYTLIVTWRALRQRDYTPVLEDWLWHNAFPLGAYVVLIVAAVGVEPEAGWRPFTMAAMTLLLLFIGIHNAWDAVAFNAVQHAEGERQDPASTP